MEKFFFGIDGTTRDRLVDWPEIMVSAATLWDGKKRVLRTPDLHPSVKWVFLDSGGFSFGVRSGGYPFTPAEYAAIIGGLAGSIGRTILEEIRLSRLVREKMGPYRRSP